MPSIGPHGVVMAHTAYLRFFFAVYFDHRGASGTHGVYLHSSAGMDVKIDQDANGQQYLEYNLMSGIIDLFFMAGPTPTEVSKQYAEVAGLPAEVPYWSFGLHQCRYGYRDFYGVAEVVANYSAAGIPLETMWTDIGTCSALLHPHSYEMHAH